MYGWMDIMTDGQLDGWMDLIRFTLPNLCVMQMRTMLAQGPTLTCTASAVYHC